MKIYLQDLKNLLTSVQIHRVQELKVFDDNFELIISNLPGLVLNYNRDLKPTYPTLENNNTILSESNLVKDSKVEKLNDYITITSPMVGTFYRAASPEEPPFIQVSDTVHINQTVCIIEAMKLMNEIEAEISGKIIDILVEDGEFVDCGQALMIVEPLEKK